MGDLLEIIVRVEGDILVCLQERVGVTTSAHEKVRGGQLDIVLGTMDTREK